MKIAVIGCGLRTPLLLHGLAHCEQSSGLSSAEVFLHDAFPHRAELMAALGNAIAQRANARLRVSYTPVVEDAVQDCTFVVSSIRVGGIEARARDERLAVDCGFAGQETTGPGGVAMALRTLPVALRHARVIEDRAPRAWLINFTNPAGIITQAVSTYSGVRVVGVCDTPAELFHRMASALGERIDDLEFDYFGLNHLGWVRGISLLGEDLTSILLNDDALLRRLYPAELFPPGLIRALGLIPTEYLFFYYRHKAALANQIASGATRAEELLQLNHRVLAELAGDVATGDIDRALDTYKAYLNRRNASYLRLEGAGESAMGIPEVDWDPFAGATGYHRIAIQAMLALCSSAPVRMVLNVANRGSITDLEADDVVEVPCMIDRSGAVPVAAGYLPETVRGLTLAVKAYERRTIRAAVEGSAEQALFALMLNPIVGDWESARDILAGLLKNDPEHLGYLQRQAAAAGSRIA